MYISAVMKAMIMRPSTSASALSPSRPLDPESKAFNYVMWHIHDDAIKWKYFPRYCPFVRGIHRWPVLSPHKGQRRGALIFFSKRLSKQSRRCWFETPCCSLWRHCNVVSHSPYTAHWQTNYPLHSSFIWQRLFVVWLWSTWVIIVRVI